MHMIPRSTHVCLVSEQPLPNLTPALDNQFGADRVILLESPHMQPRATNLANVLGRHGRQVVRQTIDDRGDLAAFRAQVNAVLREFPDALLNATGGLKTMSILAFDAFRAAGQPIFYVERDNRLIWLHPLERPGQRLLGNLGLEDYFAAFGQTLTSLSRQPDCKDGGPAWIDRLQQLPPPGQGDHNRLGTRFESLVYRVCQQIIASRHDQTCIDLAWSVRAAGAIEDEFDIVLVRDNVLHLIECKHSNGANLNHFLNKLDNLRRKRGITARAALVTTADVPVKGGHVQRAKEAGILLLGRRDLPRLRPSLAEWMGLQQPTAVR